MQTGPVHRKSCNFWLFILRNRTRRMEEHLEASFVGQYSGPVQQVLGHSVRWYRLIWTWYKHWLAFFKNWLCIGHELVGESRCNQELPDQLFEISRSGCNRLGLQTTCRIVPHTQPHISSLSSNSSRSWCSKVVLTVVCLCSSLLHLFYCGMATCDPLCTYHPQWVPAILPTHLPGCTQDSKVSDIQQNPRCRFHPFIPFVKLGVPSFYRNLTTFQWT